MEWLFKSWKWKKVKGFTSVWVQGSVLVCLLSSTTAMRGKRKREWEKEREGEKRDRVFQLVLFSLSLPVTPLSSRCGSSPVNLCMSACHSLFYSEAICCPFLSSLLFPTMSLLKKKGRYDNPSPVDFLPVTVGYFAIGGSACTSLWPST